MFRVPVQVNGLSLKSVVDTAAEVTLLSDKVYHELSDRPSKIKDANLRTAGRQLTMKGFVAGPFDIIIKDNKYREDHDDMLLGLDFLRKAEALMNLPEEYLRLGTSIINELKPEGDIQISAVKVCKSSTIPPNSITRLACEVSYQEVAYCLEAMENGKLLIACTLHEGGTNPVVC
jgi:hypothetical protein